MRARILSSASIGLLALAVLPSCGGGEAGGGAGGKGGAVGGTGSVGGTGATGGAGAGTGSGGNGGSSGGFRLSGVIRRGAAVALPAGSPSEGNVAKLAAAPATPTPKTVTHVMAVNPSSQNPSRVLAPIGSDGKFQLNLEPGHPWVVVFVDSTKVGDEMIAGVFRASELDTVAPMQNGSTDVGMVDVAADGTATAGIAYADLLAAMHLSSDGADYLAEMDDVCLRYVNPDIDGDGKIDLDQQDHQFQLDFHVQHGMNIGQRSASVADVIGDFLPTTVSSRYGGVGIYASYRAAFASPATADMWAAFEEPIVYYPASSTGPSTPRTAGAGEHIPGADLMTLGFSEMRSQGVYAATGHDLPQGDYQFGAGAATLTFTDVQTHTDAELTAAEGLIMPFIRFMPTDGCTADCAVAGIDYRWMKRTSAGWVMATQEEVTLVVSEQGGFVSIVKGNDNGSQRLMWTIPVDMVSGTIASSSAHLEGITEADAAAMKTTEICHVGISYDDKLGMRMFSGIENAKGTCPMR